MRLGEIPLAPDVEQILDAVEIEEESVAATAGEECVVARPDEVGPGAERDLCIGNYLLPDSFDRARLRALGQKHVESLLSVLRRRKNVAERDVRQQITVGVDVEPIDGVGMERVGIWICVEDDHDSGRVGGRLERVEIAQVESLVAERRTEAKSSKMIRHFSLLSESRHSNP